MKDALKLLGLLVLFAAAVWYSLSRINPSTGALDPRGEFVAQGLDLKGGMRVALEPDRTKPEGQNVSPGDMQRVRDVIENRVNAFGLSGTEVRLKGSDQILVVLPGVSNPEEALKTLVTVAQLEFRYFSDVQNEKNPGGKYRMNVRPGDAEKGEQDTYTFTDAETGKPVPTTQVIQESQLILKGSELKPTSRAEIQPQSAKPVVTFELNAQGAKVFGDFTTDHVGETLAVVLDENVISAPTINEPITEGHGEISGSKTMQEARALANLLNSGALPVPLQTAETQVVGATLGKESIERSIQAGLAGLALVLVFMLAYYWLPGAIACIALLFYAALTFCIYKGVFIFRPIPLDLPGITGFILSVGMAVDANILIFERLKEELRAGKTLHAAIDAGFNRAFSSIFDSNVTTWIVCAVLIWLGAPIIKGFAITLAIGVAVSMFTAITVTRTILHLVVAMPWARNEALYGLNVGWLNLFFPAARQGAVLQVFAKRRIYLGFTVLLAVLSLVGIALTPFGMGLKPGIDFTGGSEIEVAFRNPVPKEKIEAVLQEAGVRDAQVRIARSERPWTKVEFTTTTEVDDVTRSRIQQRLQRTVGLETFDPAAYQPAAPGTKPFKATATYVGEVTQNQIESALRTKLDANDVDLNLQGLSVTTTPIPHTGDAAIQIANITTGMTPTQLRGLGGGTPARSGRAGKTGPASAGALENLGGLVLGTPAQAAPPLAQGTSGTGAAPAAANAPAARTPAANAPAVPGPAANTPAAANAPAGPAATTGANTPAPNAPAANAPAANAPGAAATANAPAANVPAANAPATNAPAANAPAANAPAAAATGAAPRAGEAGEEPSTLRARLAAIPEGGGIIAPLYQESSIGPTVAREVTLNAFASVLVASLAIILYLAFRFAIGGFVNGLKFGGCAVVALIHDVVITIGFFAVMGAVAGWRVDSLFVTACLTVMGFSVHDTIVVYDRIRENLIHRRKGETFAEVSDRSITQTFDRSINTSFTVVLVVAALVFFGGETVRLFNVALLFGIIIGTYSSIFVASPLVVMLERSIATRETAQVAARPGPAARREDVALTPRRGTGSTPPASRPASGAPARESRTATAPRVEPSAETGGDEATEEAGDPGVDRNRPGAVRPRRKRRM